MLFIAFLLFKKKSILGHKNCPPPQGLPALHYVVFEDNWNHTFARLSCLASERITSLGHNLFPWGHHCSAKLSFWLWEP